MVIIRFQQVTSSLEFQSPGVFCPPLKYKFMEFAHLFPSAKEPEIEVVEEPAGPPEPEPGSAEWEYVAEPLDDVS